MNRFAYTFIQKCFAQILDFVLFPVVEKLLSNFRDVRNLEAFLNYVSFYKRKGTGWKWREEAKDGK